MPSPIWWSLKTSCGSLNSEESQQTIYCYIYKKCPKNAPIKQTKMAKYGRCVNVPKWSKRVRNGKPRCFWQFGTFWGPSGHFWTISDKNQFVALWGQSRQRGAFEQKIIFCLKWSKRVQKGPKEFQMVKNNYVDHFGPFWTTLECWQACHVWPFLLVLLVHVFWTPCTLFDWLWWQLPFSESNEPDAFVNPLLKM